jgi:hypothetical protein
MAAPDTSVKTASEATRFIRLFFGLTAVLLLATGLVNLLMDPFDLFGMPRWVGINAEKSQYQKFLRMAKAHEVRLRHPRGILLGTSRAENLDPDHPGWAPAARPAYNLALQSARIYEILHYLRHAQAQQPLRQVLLALDYQLMFEPHIRNQQGFDEARLDWTPTPEINGAWANDMMLALLSFDALGESWRTLRAQTPPPPVVYLKNGVRHPGRFQVAIDEVGGHRNMFTRHIGAGGVSQKARAAVYQPYEVFRQILKFCRREGIDLRLMINPEHAWAQEKQRLSGIIPEFAAWKQQLVSLLQAEARHAPGARPFPLWDFSGFNSITMEAVPAPGDQWSRMRWYWEYSHYKAETGHLMLDRVFGVESSRLRGHPDFGVLLNTTNLDAQQRRMEEGHEAWRRAHPEDVAEIARLVQGAPNRQHKAVQDE